MSNSHWQCSRIIIFLCKYYIVILDTLVGSSWMYALCARCNINRTSWVTKKERLSYRKKYIEEFVQGISLFWLHPLLSMSFSRFFLSTPSPFPSNVLAEWPLQRYIVLLWVLLCNHIMSERLKIWKSPII